jgi:DNA replication protein DnaC
MNTALFTESMEARLHELAHQFRLPTLTPPLVRRLTDAGLAEALPVVLEVFEGEQQARHLRRVERLRRASQLPPGKTFAALQEGRFPRTLLAKLRELARGQFLDQPNNVLAFGKPGVGKSHALAAVGHALVERGRSVLWAPAFQVVQELLAAKRDLTLPRALRRYDAFDALILDDIGYIQQSAEEAEVLFTLMAERYERRSLLISSNLMFSEWERIFKNPMTTLAAIDRLVHHAIILEFSPMRSFRGEAAKQRATRAPHAGDAPAADATTTPSHDNHDTDDNHDNHDDLETK